MPKLDSPSRLLLATRERTEIKPDYRLQACVERAAKLAGTPTAAISLVLQTIQLYRAHVGLPRGLAATRATSRSLSFCQLVVQSDGPVMVADTRRDPRVPQDLAREYSILAYAGVPIRIDGETLGALCVIDYIPRTFDERLADGLAEIAAAVADLLAPQAAQAPPSRCHCAKLQPTLQEPTVVAQLALLRLEGHLAAAERLSGPLTEEESRAAALEILDLEDAHTSLRGALAACRSQLHSHGLAPLRRWELQEQLSLGELALAEAEPWMRLSKALLSGYLDSRRTERAARVLRDSLQFHPTLVSVVRALEAAIPILGPVPVAC